MALAFSHEIIFSKIDLLAKRRDYLSEQRDHLNTLIEEASEVIQVATSWIAEGDGPNKLTFMDISRMTEDRLVRLCATDFSAVCDKPMQRSAASQPQSEKQGKVAVVPDDLERIMTQMKEMQESISSLSTSTENISEKQLYTDEQIKNLSNKYFKTQQQRLKDIEKELKNISENQKGIVEQQNNRMKSIENIIKHVENEQSDIVESCGEQMRKIEEQKKESEMQSQQLTQELNKLSDNVDEHSIEISLLKDDSLISSHLDYLENKVNNLETSSEDLSVKLEGHGSTLEEFTRKTEDTLKSLTSDSESRFEKFLKLEEKLAALELNLSEVSPKSEKFINSLESKFNMQWELVNNRLAILEELRNIFNANLNERTKNIKRLDIVCDQMTTLLPHLSSHVPSTVLEDLRAKSKSVLAEDSRTEAQTEDSGTQAQSLKNIWQQVPIKGSVESCFKYYTGNKKKWVQRTNKARQNLPITTTSLASPSTAGTSVPTLGASASTSVPTLGASVSTAGILASLFGTSVSTYATSAPTAATLMPITVTSAPAVATSKSTFGTHGFTFATPASTVATSAPTIGMGGLTFATPASTVATSAPTIGMSRFTFATPASTVATSAPTIGIGGFTFGTPA